MPLGDAEGYVAHGHFDAIDLGAQADGMIRAFGNHYVHGFWVVLVGVVRGFFAQDVPGIGRFLFNGDVVALGDSGEQFHVAAILRRSSAALDDVNLVAFGIVGVFGFTIVPNDNLVSHHLGLHAGFVPQHERTHADGTHNGYLGFHDHRNAFFLALVDDFFHLGQNGFRRLGPSGQGESETYDYTE